MEWESFVDIRGWRGLGEGEKDVDNGDYIQQK
jgi:hypothetical protein